MYLSLISLSIQCFHADRYFLLGGERLFFVLDITSSWMRLVLPPVDMDEMRVGWGLVDGLNAIVRRQTLTGRGPVERALYEICYDRNHIVDGTDQLFRGIAFAVQNISAIHARGATRDTYRSVIVLF